MPISQNDQASYWQRRKSEGSWEHLGIPQCFQELILKYKAFAHFVNEVLKMNSNLISSTSGKSMLSRRFTIITAMFLSILIGLSIYTLAILQKDRSYGFLIDIAGRQRMLLQKHINEVFLTSQDVAADYTSTRKLILSTLNALMDGGSVVLNPDTNQRQTVPSVPTEEIKKKLREQQNHIEHIFQLADRFLLLTPDDLEFQPLLQTLRTQHSLAIRTADEAVKQLGEYSDSAISTMVQWEILSAIFVGLLGVFVTSKGVRDGRKLEKEVEERIRVESALRNSEMFLNSIVENIPHMIFVKTAKDLRFVRLNKAGEKLLDRSRGDLMGKTDHDMFPKEQADFFTTKDREVLTHKKLVDITEEPIHTKSKGLRHLHTKKIPLLDEQGRPQYLLGISEDITERKEQNAQLKTLSDRLLLATASAKIGIWDWDLTEDALTWDEQMFSVFRPLQKNITGNYEMWSRTIHPEDRSRAEIEVQEAIHGIRDFHTEFRILWPDQSVHTIEAHAVVQRDDVGTPIRMIGVNWDISERKRTEEALRESEAKLIDALHQSDELKSALLASVSHELRTPLTAMKSSVSSIIGNLPSGMDKIQQEFLHGIDQEINYMSRLVDNLLEMSQIEAGTLVPHQEWHPLEDLVEGALRRAEQTFKRRDIDIYIPEDIPPVYVDAVEIQQVLINLFDNAAKYSSPDSPIQLHVHKETQQLVLQITNEGEPIPEQDLERIFDRFFRRPLRRDQPIRGTGLGLAICKGIIEAHGGQIWCESTNSKVTITFLPSL